MPFEPPPPLPAFLAPLLPMPRRGYVLETGADAGSALHFLDAGPEAGAGAARAVLLLHGNPTWSFLWRKVIAELPDFRCVAPDLLGFGLSADFPRPSDHALDRQADAVAELVEALGLRDLILVGQDWGGPIALQTALRLPEDRTAALLLANTAVLPPSRRKLTAFHRFARMPLLSDLAFRALGLPQNALHTVQGDRRSIRGAVARAYRWPLRQYRRRAVPLAFARLVPDGPDHPISVRLA